MSDASVAQMTHAQWLWEAEAIQQKEATEVKFVSDIFSAGVKAFRDVLVHTLGISQGQPKAKEGEVQKITPFIYFVGRPDVLEQVSKLEEAQTMGALAASDEDLDALNEELMRAARISNAKALAEMKAQREKEAAQEAALALAACAGDMEPMDLSPLDDQALSKLEFAPPDVRQQLEALGVQANYDPFNELE